MPFDQLFAFATFAYVASATPGPNNILLTAVGGAGGIRGGLPVLFGIVFGFSAMVFLLAFGLGRTVFTMDAVLDTIRAAAEWLASLYTSYWYVQMSIPDFL